MTNEQKPPAGPILDGVKTDFDCHADGLFMKKSQNIPQQFLDDLKEQRDNSTAQAEGNFMRVASIPVAVVEKWMKQDGFNIFDANVNGKEIIRRLKAENLDAFLTTNKSI